MEIAMFITTIVLIFQFYLTSAVLQYPPDCDKIECSNIKDLVCGSARSWDGNIVTSKYLNACHLKKIGCRFEDNVVVQRVADKLCDLEPPPREESIELKKNARRVSDFSIVGAHQACNHTCPTYCVDTYAPACAQIFDKNATRSINKMMINHCHVDLYSCVTGLRVTILPLARCYLHQSPLLFMSQVAGLKSLGILNENSQELKREMMRSKPRRRSNDPVSLDVKSTLRRLIYRKK